MTLPQPGGNAPAAPVPLAQALVDGGVRVLELTLRTPVALQAIAAIAAEVEGVILGVGTLTRAEDFAQSIKAGANGINANATAAGGTILITENGSIDTTPGADSSLLIAYPALRTSARA